jgi:MoxR-like ATPase
MKNVFRSIDDVYEALKKEKYICDRRLATVIYLAYRMEKPLLLEGEAGVGKTELGLVLSRALDRRLIRLQCYEGLDATTAVYEWNYTKQILRIKLAEAEHQGLENLQNIFDEEYLIRRPLLEAIRSEAHGKHVCLLIDELDRADEEFEAFLLEVLSEFQITVPEIGTLKAKAKPLVIITSNRTRELHDAIKRRCLYHWIHYPSLEKEHEIVTTKPLDPLPFPGKGTRDRHHQSAKNFRGLGFQDLLPHAAGTTDGTLQETGHCRDPGLGQCPSAAEPGSSGRRDPGRDAGLSLQASGGHGTG